MRDVAEENTELRENAHGAQPDRVPGQASEVVRGQLIELAPRFSITTEQARDMSEHRSPRGDLGMVLDKPPDGLHEPLQPAALSAQQVHLGGEAHGRILRRRPPARHPPRHGHGRMRQPLSLIEPTPEQRSHGRARRAQPEVEGIAHLLGEAGVPLDLRVGRGDVGHLQEVAGAHGVTSQGQLAASHRVGQPHHFARDVEPGLQMIRPEAVVTITGGKVVITCEVPLSPQPPGSRGSKPAR